MRNLKSSGAIKTYFPFDGFTDSESERIIHDFVLKSIQFFAKDNGITITKIKFERYFDYNKAFTLIADSYFKFVKKIIDTILKTDSKIQYNGLKLSDNLKFGSDIINISIPEETINLIEQKINKQYKRDFKNTASAIFDLLKTSKDYKNLNNMEVIEELSQDHSDDCTEDEILIDCLDEDLLKDDFLTKDKIAASYGCYGPFTKSFLYAGIIDGVKTVVDTIFMRKALKPTKTTDIAPVQRNQTKQPPYNVVPEDKFDRTKPQKPVTYEKEVRKRQEEQNRKKREQKDKQKKEEK